MTETHAGAAAGSRRRLTKAAAITHAACGVFARDGYSRATVDAIAAEAGASTRTLYNHFPGGKEELFRTVIQWSSRQVRDEQTARLRKYLDPERPPRPEDLERDLLLLARSWVALMTDFQVHFSLVRHIHVEAAHIPRETLEAWQESGPRAVRREFAAAIAVLRDHGLIDAHGDAELAAVHFMALITIAERPYPGADTYSPQEADRVAGAGVRAFLRAYGTG